MGESVGTEFTRVIRQSLRGLNNSTLDKYGRGSRHTWLSKEQIATIRYIMQHPDIRPTAWTSSGHGDVEATDIVPPILNATPKINRVGLKNWQIIYTAEEVMAARAQGKFATNDGYIFIAEDVLDPASFVFSQAFSLPRATGGSLRSVSKKDLSKAELEAVQALLDKRDAEELAKNVTPIEKREGLKNWQIVHSAKERPASSEGWGTVKKTVSEPTKVSESSESAVPSTQSSLSETDAQVTNETAETAPHTPTETTTKDATGAVVKESEENALADHATEDSARYIVDEKSIVPEKTKEKAHQESTAVSAVNNE